jgi:hypothetical protein
MIGCGRQNRRVSIEQNKLLVRRLIDEAVAHHISNILDELAADDFASTAKRWAQRGLEAVVR